MEDNKILVSDLFFEIFKNFNVDDQTEKMINLPEDELYLLLDSCVESHDSDDKIVILNFMKFKNELELINEAYSNTNNFELISKLNKVRVNSNGDYLPETYTKNQVREIRLNKLFEK
jgi:hypothetical protein